MIQSNTWRNNKYSFDGVEIDAIIDQAYPNSIEYDETHIVCQNCGEKLYDGDTYYPELGVCEHCLSDYKEGVEID